MKAAGLVLVIFGVFLWLGVLLLFAGITRQAARLVTPRANRIEKLRYTGNPLRIWREHAARFPYSSQRRAVVVLSLAALACVSLGFYLAE